jgi:hypothetical protein
MSVLLILKIILIPSMTQKTEEFAFSKFFGFKIKNNLQVMLQRGIRFEPSV